MGCTVSRSSHEKMMAYREQMRDEETTSTYYSVRGQPDGEENIDPTEQVTPPSYNKKCKSEKNERVLHYHVDGTPKNSSGNMFSSGIDSKGSTVTHTPTHTFNDEVSNKHALLKNS